MIWKNCLNVQKNCLNVQKQGHAQAEQKQLGDSNPQPQSWRHKVFST